MTDCDRCQDPITGTPVTDPDDLMGRKYCRDECRDDAGHAWAEQHYGYGAAT